MDLTSYTLVNFYSNIYTSRETQMEWDNAIKVHIFKTQKKKQPRNYAGTSLLNTCYKILSKMLNAKLKLHSEKFFNGTPI